MHCFHDGAGIRKVGDAVSGSDPLDMEYGITPVPFGLFGPLRINMNLGSSASSRHLQPSSSSSIPKREGWSVGARDVIRTKVMGRTSVPGHVAKAGGRPS